MEQEQKFVCTGNCIQCIRQQREYCSAQKAYENQQLLLSLTGKLEELEAKIAAIQDSEAMVFATNEAAVVVQHSEQDIAQEGDGAEE